MWAGLCNFRGGRDDIIGLHKCRTLWLSRYDIFVWGKSKIFQLTKVTVLTN